MATTLTVERVARAQPRQGAFPHQNRFVVAPTDYEAQSPFLMMAEDWFAPPAGFPTHPHRGQETVTFVLEGSLEHRDHTGAHGQLSTGDVQFMTAGAGVLHSEMPGPEGVHSLQLWLNLPARLKTSKARYADRRLADTPVVAAPGLRARVYTGALGDVEAPPLSVWPMTLIDVALDAGATYALPVHAKSRAFVYVLDGAGAIGGKPVRDGDIAWASAENAGTLGFAASSAMRALFYSAEIIREPIASYGPFVMNTEDEIRKAILDYQAGKLTA
jgi:redox-sensitive bicupin YhaK (pirin superfamily)